MDWYPDPADATRERYWDGGKWTNNTRVSRMAPPAAPPAPQAAGTPVNPDPYTARPNDPAAGAPGVGYGPYNGATGQQSGAPAVWQQAPVGAPAQTADGVALSGWWRRALAYIVDMMVLGVLTSLVGWKWVRQVRDGYMAYIDDLLASANAGQPLDPAAASQALEKYNIASALTPLSLVGMAVMFAYFLLMWKFLGASLGQLLTGIRVVPTDQGRSPRQLGWLPAVMRSLLITVVSQLPLLPLVSYLMPLWTSRRQSLHDMAARTQVVRSR